MKIYNYHPLLKIFKSESEANPSPLEPGVFLIPANATKIAPPNCTENESAFFENEAWVKKINRVGQHYYKQDGTKVEITKYGISVPVGCTQEDPPSKYYDTHNGTTWIKNQAAEDADIVLGEINELKSDLKNALIWQFRMISELYELGVSKGIWSGSDISNSELKQKYAEWKTKLTRLNELGE